MKYRKKPVVIEATQYLGQDGDECIPGVEFTGDGDPFIQTLEGPLQVTRGDWIITGVKGEKYPCKPDIFEATYDKED